MASAALARSLPNTGSLCDRDRISFAKQKCSYVERSASPSPFGRSHLVLARPALQPAQRLAPSTSYSHSSSSSTGLHAAVTSESFTDSSVRPATSAKCVLVIGGTGGVGQLVVAALLDRGFNVRVILRDINKATTVFGEHNMDKMQVFVGDTRKVGELEPTTWEGVTHVICCTGTTAFPSKRWDGDNTPENTGCSRVCWVIFVENACRSLSQHHELTDINTTNSRGKNESIHSRNMYIVCSQVLVGDLCAVCRSRSQHHELIDNDTTEHRQLSQARSIMNLFGVLKYKKMGEDYLCKSGIPFTIIRAGRLTDGPYTSYDLNTLLKATAGTRRRVVLGHGDKLVGEASRIVVAEACIQALDIDCTCGKIYEINSVEGDGPGTDQKKWEALFTQVLVA